MKLEEFRSLLRKEMEVICASHGWNVSDNKQRGMAFEDWCFDFFATRYPTAENNKTDSILRTNDEGIDIVFESKDTEEVYLIQCKHPKIAQTEPIVEDDVIRFFSAFNLLTDVEHQKKILNNSGRIEDLKSELEYWQRQGFTITLLFISNGKMTVNVAALADKYSKDHIEDNLKFEVWGLSELKDAYVESKSVEEAYPERVIINVPDSGYFRLPSLEYKNVTFAISGNALADMARQHKETLFNWNIRRYLGKKGQVNKGMMETISTHPQHFFYFNNGISALCEMFEFDEVKRVLTVHKMQIVNGAQTVGAIKNSDAAKLKDVRVLVKLTAVKHHQREGGIAADLIRTNNTQNSLRVPDFRSNDKIQLWLEKKFKDTKPRGNLPKIIYGRKRPYPRQSSEQIVMKMQDVAKIRYAWMHDPRVPFAEPASLFLLPEDKGLYGYAFGDNGTEVNIFSDAQFDDLLLAIHCFRRVSDDLNLEKESHEDLKQITRLHYYGLRLMKIYIDGYNFSKGDVNYEDILAFGGKFNQFYSMPRKLIVETLSQSYRDMLRESRGTAFSLPRDAKVWENVKTKFDEYLRITKLVSA
jgi:hypothetical protein